MSQLCELTFYFFDSSDKPVSNKTILSKTLSSLLAGSLVKEFWASGTVERVCARGVAARGLLEWRSRERFAREA